MMRRAVRPLQLTVSAALLILLYRENAIADVAATLALATPGPLLAACGLVLVMHGIVAWRLRLLVVAHGVSLAGSDALAVHLASMFYKLFVPGGSVGNVAVRILRLYREVGSRAGNLTVAVVVERISATAALCVVGLACWALAPPPLPQTLAIVITGCFAAVSVLSLILLTPASARLAYALVERLDRATLSGWLEHGLFAVEPSRALPTSRILLLVFLSLAVHVLGAAVFLCLASALAIPGDLFAWGLIRAAVILVTMMPVSVAGLGVRDISLVYLLGFYGVGGDHALALASLVFFVTVLFVALLGGVSEVLRALGIGSRSAPAEAQKYRE